jgi:hypothetical protein
MYINIHYILMHNLDIFTWTHILKIKFQVLSKVGSL